MCWCARFKPVSLHSGIVFCKCRDTHAVLWSVMIDLSAATYLASIFTSTPGHSQSFARSKGKYAQTSDLGRSQGSYTVYGHCRSVHTMVVSQITFWQDTDQTQESMWVIVSRLRGTDTKVADSKIIQTGPDTQQGLGLSMSSVCLGTTCSHCSLMLHSFTII